MNDNLRATCAKDGCDRVPTHYPMVRIPAVGHPADRCIKGTMGLALCRSHAQTITIEEIFTGEGQAFVTALTASMKLEKPDFERASIEVRRIGDANWLAFLEANAASAGGGRA